MADLTYPKALAPYTFRKGYSYTKYLEDQSHFDNLATNIDQNIAKLALSNVEVTKLSTRAMVESQREATSQISQGLDSIRVGIDRLDDSIVDLRQSVDDVRWAIDEVRYSIESGFQLTAQRLSAIEAVLQDLLEAVKSPERTWALEKYDIAKDLYRRELYEDALSYLNDALHGHEGHRGYLFDPRVHMLKGNILLGDGQNYEGKLIDLPAAKKSFDEAVKYAKPPREMLSGLGETGVESLFQPRVFARCSSAWTSYVQGLIAEAEQDYREAIKEGPNDARAHYYLGKVLAHQDRFEEAESHLGMAIRLNFFYVAKLATDEDYLKDGTRFERKVAEYRVELIDRLKPLAEVLCLLNGPQASELVEDWLKRSDSWQKERIPKSDLSVAISASNAEIGPMVSNYDQLKRDAHKAQKIFEMVADQCEKNLANIQSRKREIRKPVESDVPSFRDKRLSIEGVQFSIGIGAAFLFLLLSGIYWNGSFLGLSVLAASYAFFAAPLIARIDEDSRKDFELRRLLSEHQRKIDGAESEINSAAQKNAAVKSILVQLQQITAKLNAAAT